MEERMTIQEYINSVRQSLNSIEQDADTGTDPGPPCNEINFSNLEAIAGALARRYRNYAKFRKDLERHTGS